MTLHRFPQKPQVHVSDVGYARDSMESARHGATDIAADIEHHERILATVGPKLSPLARSRMQSELAALREMQADAESEAAVWQEAVQALMCLDAADDRPGPDEG